MKICDAVGKHIAELAAVTPAELPGWVREHTAACRQCHRRLAAARLVRGAIRSGAAALEPPVGFASRVAASAFRQPTSRGMEAEFWRPAWGLVPAFGAVVVALLIAFQGSLPPEPNGLFLTEGLSTGERLVLGSSAPDEDTVLAAVFEGGGI